METLYPAQDFLLILLAELFRDASTVTCISRLDDNSALVRLSYLAVIGWSTGPDLAEVSVDRPQASGTAGLRHVEGEVVHHVLILHVL